MRVSGVSVFVTALLVLTALSAVFAGARRPDPVWTLYHFDGKTFSPGSSSPNETVVAVCNGMRPVVTTQPGNIPESRLASGSGALVGICYIQSSGGKLRPGPAFIPIAHSTITIERDGITISTLNTDAQGYFIAEIPAGRYTVKGNQFTLQITITDNTTTFVPLRAGKRMAD